MRKKSGLLVALFAAVALAVPTVTFAASSTSLSQTIGAGTLTVDIVDTTNNNAPVASPSVDFGSTPWSFDCKTTTATLGTSTQSIFVSNPITQNVSVKLGSTAGWTDGGSNTYAVGGADCTTGKMTVSGGAFTKTKGVDPTGSVSGGSFSGSTSSVTLLNTSTSARWAGKLEGFTLSQQIPAGQAEATYTTSMNLTATSL